MSTPKTKVEIPKGFRALREDETVTSSDLYSMNWSLCSGSVGKTPKRMNESRRIRGRNEAVYIRAVEPDAAPKADVKPTIPAGYRLLGAGEVIAEGDKVWHNSSGWTQVGCTVGHEIYPGDVSWFFCIRAVETPSEVQRCGSTGKVIIPSGWRRLERNDFRQAGDLFEAGGEWVPTKVPGKLVGDGATGPYIRRVESKAEKAPTPQEPAENLWQGKPAKFSRGEIVTPRGWRRLFRDERIKKGDFFIGSAKMWLQTGCAGAFADSDNLAYFRRIS